MDMDMDMEEGNIGPHPHLPHGQIRVGSEFQDIPRNEANKRMPPHNEWFTV